nr:hypothetical protein [Tanacetum cinerariifolium]
MQVVQVLLLVVQVRADDLVSAGGCTLPTGSYSFLLLDWFQLVVLLVHADEFDPTGCCSISTGRSYCWIGPSDIITNIDCNEVVVTESLIRTQLQLADVNGLYEFTLHDVLDVMRAIGFPTDGSLTFYKAKLSPQWRFIMDGMIGNIGSRRHKCLMYPRFLQMILVHASGDAAGTAANVDAGPGPSSAPQVLPVREPSPMREPTPVREPSPRPEQEPTIDSPSPPSPPPSSATIGPTTSSRPPSPSRHPFVPEDIRKGGDDFVSSPQSKKAPQTPVTTAAGGAKDFVVLTALSLKLDRNRRSKLLLEAPAHGACTVNGHGSFGIRTNSCSEGIVAQGRALQLHAGGDAAGTAANIDAGPGPSSAPQVPTMREPSPMREPTPVREPSPRPEQEPTLDFPSPPSPPPSSATIGPTTSSRPPSPSRHPFVPEDIRKGGGDFVSSPQSKKAPQTPVTTATGGAKDFTALTALSLKLDRCLHRVTTLENELGITKK